MKRIFHLYEPGRICRVVNHSGWLMEPWEITVLWETDNYAYHRQARNYSELVPDDDICMIIDNVVIGDNHTWYVKTLLRERVMGIPIDCLHPLENDMSTVDQTQLR